MNAVAYALRSFLRELRSGEVQVLLAAVGLAVAALTPVGFLTDRIGKAVAQQANEVLAADLRLRSQNRVPDEWRELAVEYGLETAETLTFPSVVFAGDNSVVVDNQSGQRKVSAAGSGAGVGPAACRGTPGGTVSRHPARFGRIARYWRGSMPTLVTRCRWVRQNCGLMPC